MSHQKNQKNIFKPTIKTIFTSKVISAFGISHLQQQQNIIHNSAIYSTWFYIFYSALFSTLQLYGKHSTLYLFDPPTQNTYIYVDYRRLG